MEFLAYFLGVGVPLLIAGGLGLVLPLMLLQSYRQPGFGMGLITVLAVFEALVPGFEGFQLGIRLYVPDLVTLVLAIATFLRFIFLQEARPRVPAWYLFIGAFFASLGLGLATLGTSAGVSARHYFYAVVTTSYLLSFPGSLRMVRSLVGHLAVLTVALFVLVIARWIIQFLPIPDLLPETGQFASVEASLLRVIPSQEAVLLAQVFALGLFYPGVLPALRLLRPVLPMLLLMVVALQHRSVWLATMAAIGSRFALPQAGRTASFQLAALAAVVALAGVGVVLSGKGGGAAQDIARSAGRAVAMSDTADARLGSWRFMSKKVIEGGPRAILVGLPFGTSSERLLLGDNRQYTRISFQAHNFYVQTFFNLGLIGVVGAVAFFAWVLRSLYRGLRDPELGTASGAMLLLIVAQVTYYLPYGVNYVQGLILGAAGALALTVEARRRDAPPAAVADSAIPGRGLSSARPRRHVPRFR